MEFRLGIEVLPYLLNLLQYYSGQNLQGTPHHKTIEIYSKVHEKKVFNNLLWCKNNIFSRIDKNLNFADLEDGWPDLK